MMSKPCSYKRVFWVSLPLVTISVLLIFLTPVSGQAPVAKTGEAPALPPSANVTVDFERDVAPIFAQKCEACHGSSQQMSGLRLDSRAAVLKGGYSGAAIEPGKSGESRLIYMVAGIPGRPLMPMGSEKLSDEQIGLLRAWIDQGAEWPEPKLAHRGATESRPKHPHWAFNAPQRPALPKVKNEAWVENPIDAFVLAKLEAQGIEPSPEVNRRTLARRVSLDLIGLPPTPQEIDRFLNDPREGAYERYVDGLLKSPHYGEKWARHWLDQAHYADTDGYETDHIRPHAWRWRDWVINALNSNMPFDQFTVEQIAGDLLPNATIEQRIATGFLRNTLTNREGGIDREEFRVEQVIDRSSTVGTIWLGMTVGCARCHDHKYDPLTQKEFYQLYAFFNTAHEVNIEVPRPQEIARFLRDRAAYRAKRDKLLAEYKVPELQPEWEKKVLFAADNPGVDPSYTIGWDVLGVKDDGGQEALRTHPAYRTEKQQELLTNHYVFYYRVIAPREEYEKLKFAELYDKLKELKKQYPALGEAQVIAENPDPPKSHVLIRGDFRSHGVEVQPGAPAVLHPMPADGEPARLALARWLVADDNPLTARVTMNRTWQEFFGRGLVETSEDFGARSEPPTHPELLDWLATEFRDGGWDMKAMHKRIVVSATYRQASHAREDLKTRDPSNLLLARQSRLRLSAESIRDTALSVSGLLNPMIGGKSVRPPQPDSVLELGFGVAADRWIEHVGPDRYRRGLYILFLRTTPYPQLVTFDAPDMVESCSRRLRSNTPLQALNLLNDPVFFEAAQVLAARVLRERPGSVADRLDYAYRLSLGRPPRPQEKDRLLRYYEEQKNILGKKRESIEVLFPAVQIEGVDPEEAAVWVGVSRLLLNLEEFITRS